MPGLGLVMNEGDTSKVKTSFILISMNKNPLVALFYLVCLAHNQNGLFGKFCILPGGLKLHDSIYGGLVFCFISCICKEGKQMIISISQKNISLRCMLSNRLKI